MAGENDPRLREAYRRLDDANRRLDVIYANYSRVLAELTRDAKKAGPPYAVDGEFRCGYVGCDGELDPDWAYCPWCGELIEWSEVERV